MKKSLMLSTTIMLIILFVALSATTFAWYQAQGGTINVSGSSTASVTTTGPDSPYLIVSAYDESESGPAAEDFSTVVITDSNISTYSTANFDTSNTARNRIVAVPTITSNTWTFTDIAGNSTEVADIVFYVRNTGSSFELASNISITATIGETNNVDLLQSGRTNKADYCVALVMTNSSHKTVIYSQYHSAEGTLTSTPTVAGETTTSEINSVDTTVNKFYSGIYECHLYIWIDAYDNAENAAKRANSSVVESILDISNIQIKFDNISIVTSN